MCQNKSCPILMSYHYVEQKVYLKDGAKLYVTVGNLLGLVFIYLFEFILDLFKIVSYR